ncbi:MAG TPA: hypothetical protein IAD08_08175 [Candidatus Scatovivens faecipullorum]|nr:hypothetical protein [Candidatus Scatovivens faecipullorum]
MNEENINLTELILNSINELFSKMFSSIDNTIYSVLDEVTFINNTILENDSFKKILGESSQDGILLICNSLVLGFIIYYAINYLFSHLTYSKIDSPKQFIFKSIIFIAIMNSSLWICLEIINIISVITDGISYISQNLFGIQISFSNFIDNINKNLYIQNEAFNVFSIDGIIKSFISFGLINLVFTYSLRYIMIQIFILLSPFAFLSLISNSSESFFRAWIKVFLSLLLVQILISLILLLSFSIELTSNTNISKFLYVGIIYALSKATSYIKEIFGGISIDIKFSLSPNLKS